MSRNTTGDRSASICLEEILQRRLEGRLRRIDRIRAVEPRPYAEPEAGASLQALTEKLTRLRFQARLDREPFLS